MTAPRACRHCLALGLIFSAVLHGTAVPLWLRVPASEPPTAAPLVLELAQFDPVPPAMAAAAPEPSTPAEPPSAPPPMAKAPTPAPELADLPSPPSPAEPPARPRSKARTERPKPRPEPKPLPVKRDAPRREAPVRTPAAAPPKRPPLPLHTPARWPPTAPVPSTNVTAPRLPVKPATPTGVLAAVPAAPPHAPAGSPAPRAKAPAAPPHPGESVGAYLAEVQRAVARGKVYPEEARRTRKTGTAVVAFLVQSNGTITGVRLARSSGDPSLDRAALAAVGRVGRVRPIPASAGRSSWALQVPIRFALR